MSQEGKQIFERLGLEGLVQVLDDVFDHKRLVRLANACALRYPGMRTQSQKRDRILSDLAERGLQEETARTAILRALEKATRVASRRWGLLDDEQKAQRISDEKFLLSNGNLGLHLYFLAASDGEGDRDGFEYLLARQHLLRVASQARTQTKPSKEEMRLRKRVGELQKKVQHLETQLAKSREAERSFKRDLIQRKGELAESRMLAERLRRELTEAEQTARKAASPAKVDPAPTGESLGKLTKALRQLTSDQRKLLQRVDKLPGATSAAAKAKDNGPVRLDPTSLAPLKDSIEALRKDLAARKRERRKLHEQQLASLEELRGALQRPDRPAAPTAPRGERRRAKSAAERVGVFVDVQNVYYGARRLKGKLDFDALLDAAVRGRRLIQATAYVVESKEIDQSGFIALLEQRAIEVRRKTLQVRTDGSTKGDWDMELALDILDAVPRLDVVVLVSGDGDFTSLVKRVKEIGPRVEVIGFPRTTAKSLLEAADQFQPLDRKFMIYKRRRSKAGATEGDKAAGRKAEPATPATGS